MENRYCCSSWCRKCQGCKTLVQVKRHFPPLSTSKTRPLLPFHPAKFAPLFFSFPLFSWNGGLRVCCVSSPALPAATSTHNRFSKAIRSRPGDASLYWGRSHAWERAGSRRQAVVDAGVGVCLRPRVAAGFDRLSAAYEAQGRHADVVRACYLVSETQVSWDGSRRERTAVG